LDHAEEVLKVQSLSDSNLPEVLKPGKKAFHSPAFPITSVRSAVRGFRPLVSTPVRGDYLNALRRRFIGRRGAGVGLGPDDSFRKTVRGSALTALGCGGSGKEDSFSCQPSIDLRAAADAFGPEPVRDIGKLFLMPIEDVFSISKCRDFFDIRSSRFWATN
jgi:hypothetical protein